MQLVLPQYVPYLQSLLGCGIRNRCPCQPPGTPRCYQQMPVKPITSGLRKNIYKTNTQKPFQKVSVELTYYSLPPSVILSPSRDTRPLSHFPFGSIIIFSFLVDKYLSFMVIMFSVETHLKYIPWCLPMNPPGTVCFLCCTFNR